MCVCVWKWVPCSAMHACVCGVTVVVLRVQGHPVLFVTLPPSFALSTRPVRAPPLPNPVNHSCGCPLPVTPAQARIVSEDNASGSAMRAIAILQELEAEAERNGGKVTLQSACRGVPWRGVHTASHPRLPGASLQYRVVVGRE